MQLLIETRLTVLQKTKEGSMSIKDIQQSDEGNYSCSIENIHGSDEIVYSIQVKGKCVVRAYLD